MSTNDEARQAELLLETLDGILPLVRGDGPQRFGERFTAAKAAVKLA